MAARGERLAVRVQVGAIDQAAAVPVATADSWVGFRARARRRGLQHAFGRSSGPPPSPPPPYSWASPRCPRRSGPTRPRATTPTQLLASLALACLFFVLW